MAASGAETGPFLARRRATGPWGWLGGFERLRRPGAAVDRLHDAGRRAERVSGVGPRRLPPYARSSAPGPAVAARRREPPSSGAALSSARRSVAECHAPPEYTSAEPYDVGLVDEVGHRRFNPPSLRGSGGREPLLHDGRAATLEEVFRRYRHPRDTELTDAEVADLRAFLETL